MTRRCGDCECWQRGAPPGRIQQIMVCKRFPEWRIVDADHGCFEFRPKEDPTADARLKKEGAGEPV